jgi:molecular chaperone HscA
VSDCRSLARFELRGIPPMAAGAARIRVTYQVDADGLLSVFAREQHSGVEASVVVKPSYGLADDDIARMLEDSFSAAEVDMRARALREAQVEAQRLVEATDAALAADADLLDADERGELDTLLTALRNVAQSNDADASESATKALAAGTDEFAARRMDKGIRRALAGRKLDEI